MSARDEFSPKTKEILAKRAGYFCSFETCGAVTVGPSSSDKRVANVGVASHIAAAAKGGPRFDPKMTPEQRKSEANGIWLCQIHGKHVDDDTGLFKASELRLEKSRAEKRAQARIGRPFQVTKKPLLLLQHDTLKPTIDPPGVSDLPGLLQGRVLEAGVASFVDHLAAKGITVPSLQAVVASMVAEEGALRASLSNPQVDVLYFGFPHVPFGVLAGCIAGSHRHVRLVEHDRKSGQFRWTLGDEIEVAAPVMRSRRTGHLARLFVSVSADVDERLANPVVSARESAADLRVGIKNPHRGAISDERQARLLVEDIAREVDANLSGLPDVDALHVFAAVPVSVAFLLGQRVFSGTALPPVVIHNLVAMPRPAYRWGLNLADALAGRRAITIRGD